MILSGALDKVAALCSRPNITFLLCLQGANLHHPPKALQPWEGGGMQGRKETLQHTKND